jgi:hypothetical protein
MNRTPFILGTLLALVGCGQEPSAPEPQAVQAPQPMTVSIQCGNMWKKSPQMRAYYDETVATFAKGMDIDIDAYEARSFDIFRQFARAQRFKEEEIVDAYKLIPRQMAGIIKEDPAVLKSYDAFWVALSGPD